MKQASSLAEQKNLLEKLFIDISNATWNEFMDQQTLCTLERLLAYCLSVCLSI